MKRFTNSNDIKIGEQYLYSADPKMAKLIEQYGSCNIQPWNKDLLTSLTSSIVSQQLSVKAASTIFSRVKVLCGGTDTISAEKLLSQSNSQLRECGLSQAKTRYCLALAEAEVSGELNLAELIDQDEQVIIDSLVKIPGIGVWTAQMFLVFAVGATDIMATEDLGLKRGMQRYMLLDDYPTKQQFIAESKVWQPYRSLASWYLWRLAE